SAATSREEFMNAINRGLRHGYARLTTAAEGVGAEHLVIGSDRRGSQAIVSVAANAALGFTDQSKKGSDVAANNVGDIGSVSADELNALLTKANIDVRATVNPISGKLALVTTGTGSGASLKIRDGDENAALGLAKDATDTGKAGSTVGYYVKTAT